MIKRSPVSKKRSLIKAITFRLIIIIADIFVVYLITHRVDVTFGVIFFSNITSTVLYFFHERIWNRIDLN